MVIRDGVRRMNRRSVACIEPTASHSVHRIVDTSQIKSELTGIDWKA